MKPQHEVHFVRLSQALEEYDGTYGVLPGLATASNRDVFLMQVVESIRRGTLYYPALVSRGPSPARLDPNSEIYDPVLSAHILANRGERDEAAWQAFLATHFGRHGRHGWSLAAQVFGRGGRGRWDWRAVSDDQPGFLRWLRDNSETLARWGFGNHRKYQSLKPDAKSGTVATFRTYTDWVVGAGGHAALFDGAVRVTESPGAAFDTLYVEMNAAVAGFARTGVFDYLTSIGKSGVAPIEPARMYLNGATGPKDGARSLFGIVGRVQSWRVVDERLMVLARSLDVPAHVLEDAICNWQKSPSRFVGFRG